MQCHVAKEDTTIISNDQQETVCLVGGIFLFGKFWRFGENNAEFLLIFGKNKYENRFAKIKTAGEIFGKAKFAKLPKTNFVGP